MNARSSFAVAVVCLALINPSAFAQNGPPAGYVGLGVRAWLNDSTALVIDSRITAARIADWTVSLRPALLFAGEPELRMPITLDLAAWNRLFFYGGAGIALNESRSARADPMITAGLDLAVFGCLVLDINLNHLIKPGGTDTELTVSLNCAFGEMIPR